MKKLMTMLAVFAMAGLVVLNSCKDDDEDPTPLTLATLMANDKDLNAATAASDVPVDAVITTEFSTEVDATTATNDNIMLIRTYDNSAVSKNISVSGKTITITPTDDFFEGDNYKISFTTGLKSTQGQSLELIERTFGTVGIGLGTAPKSSNQMVYLQFSNDIIDVTGNAEASFEQVGYGDDRFGNANSAAMFAGQSAEFSGDGDIVELTGTDFVAPSMTISVWVHLDAADYQAPGNKPLLGLAAHHGYFVEIGDWDEVACACTTPNWLKVTTNHTVDPDPEGHVVANQWGDFGSSDEGVLVNTLTATGWHHLVMTFDAATYTKTDYWDGVKLKTYNTLDANGEWNLKGMVLNELEGVDNTLALGFFASRANINPDYAIYSNSKRGTFKGGMDDLRLFNVALSASEVTALHDAEKP